MFCKIRKYLFVAGMVAALLCIQGVQSNLALAKVDPGLEVTTIDFAQLQSEGKPIIIDYGSAGCGPCRMMAPTLERVYLTYKDRVTIRYIDVWKHRDGAENIPLRVIPTQLFMKADGTPFVPSVELGKKVKFLKFYKKGTSDHVYTLHEGGLLEGEFRAIIAELESVK